MAVHAYQAAVGLGYNVRGTRFVLQQCALSEVVAHFVSHHLLGLLTFGKHLSGDTLALLEQVEILTVFVNLDNVVALLEFVLLESIGQLAAFVRLHGAEDADFG